ncbi:nucleotidyltransferase domain-containing protein [Sulfurimonas sp. SWIR-19]|uniref:nucleotidyltransferase family protein n=1 Tax=Sulfurimonas sp. SWIR-19 TaxID=2878390 RepID=UPI001CF37721|nr:nucleotidyltransferase domain-containing protein [Sulfurimonas sp. SWIR-19]UCN01124.1 nucleotidyltransferase domain-containing protein [Sulfurimonas sp. SWIR-19]
MNSEIINKLRTLKPVLKEKYGIEEFAVFGSVAKGTDTVDSDVDIAVLKMKIKDAFDLFKAKEFLSMSLKKPVDMGTFDSMKTFIKNRIKKDFIYV